MDAEPVLPVVTVIIPLHNHANWIESCIQSILDQDYDGSRLRLIVVNDGSSDSSEQTVLSLLKLVHTKKNPEGLVQYFGSIKGLESMLVTIPEAHGPSFARNMGIKIGWDGTDLFAFLDSDDIYAKQKISKSVEVFMKAPTHVGVVYSDYSTINEETGVRVREYKQPFSREVLLGECIVNCDSLVSRYAIEICGGFDEELRVCEDYDLWLRLSEKVIVSHIAEDLITIRVGGHSSTSNIAKERWSKDYRRVFEKTQERNA